MAGLIERRGFAKIVTGRGGANLRGRASLEVLFLIDFGVGVLFMAEGAGRGAFCKNYADSQYLKLRHVLQELCQERQYLKLRRVLQELCRERQLSQIEARFARALPGKAASYRKRLRFSG